MVPKKKECPSCAMDIDVNHKVCPICGFEFPRQKPIYQWIAVLLVIAFLLMLFF